MKNFQKANGLTVDGISGEDTQKLLFAKADTLADIIDLLKTQNGHL